METDRQNGVPVRTAFVFKEIRLMTICNIFTIVKQEIWSSRSFMNYARNMYKNFELKVTAVD
jgi:hypothetical protein